MKAEYKAKAEEDKERAKKEMAAYKAGDGKPAEEEEEEEAATKEEEEEEEEEDDDDDDE